MSKPARRAAAKQTTLRHVWLASLGAASMSRARALDATNRWANTAEDAAADATAFLRDAGLVLRGAALTVQEQASPLWSGMQARVASAVFGLLSVVERADPLTSRASHGRRATRS